MGEIKIGTCGYGYFNPGKNWKDRYESKLQAFSEEYSVVEINKTFYKLPMTKTAAKWRKQAREEFEFTLKAWQAITHSTNSPTWKDKKKLSQKQKEGFGYFQPTDVIFKAWNETKERAEAMKSSVVIFQTPASFNCSEEHINNLQQFFTKIERGGLNLAWEPRGDWKENKETVESLCKDLELIHVVDLLRDDPLSDHDISYIRLHGLNENPYDYNYNYSKDELRELSEKLQKLAKEQDKVYCMFNNFGMYENAPVLKELLL